MKIFAITNAEGKVVATVRETPGADADGPFGGRPVPQEGCTLHEITLPPALRHIRSAQEMHSELSKLIRSGQDRPGCD